MLSLVAEFPDATKVLVPPARSVLMAVVKAGMRLSQVPGRKLSAVPRLILTSSVPGWLTMMWLRAARMSEKEPLPAALRIL